MSGLLTMILAVLLTWDIREPQRGWIRVIVGLIIVMTSTSPRQWGFA